MYTTNEFDGTVVLSLSADDVRRILKRQPTAAEKAKLDKYIRKTGTNATMKCNTLWPDTYIEKITEWTKNCK